MVDDVDRLWVESMPAAYEQWLAPTVFRPFAVDLARRVASHGPARVLELAAGTGALTRELLGLSPGSAVLSTDLNAAMVEFGRQQVPQAAWQEVDAQALPFGPAEFDLVACQFGVMFFPDKRAAFAEARRVLHPDGTLVFNVWDCVEAHDFAAALLAGLTSVFPDDPPVFVTAVPHGYAEPEVVLDDVRSGGFRRISIETVTLEAEAPSAADVAAGFCTGTPLRSFIEARGDLASTVETVAKEMEARLGSGPVCGRMTAHVVEARA